MRRGIGSMRCGSIHIVPPMAVEHAYLAPLAHAVKQRVPVPVFVAGRINQPQQAEEILRAGQVDTIVAPMGHQSVIGLAEALEDWPVEVVMIGDCLAPRACEEAVLGGLYAGVTL